jgi:hypothetical protein
LKLTFSTLVNEAASIKQELEEVRTILRGIDERFGGSPSSSYGSPQYYEQESFNFKL